MNNKAHKILLGSEYDYSIKIDSPKKCNVTYLNDTYSIKMNKELNYKIVLGEKLGV